MSDAKVQINIYIPKHYINYNEKIVTALSFKISCSILERSYFIVVPQSMQIPAVDMD